MFVSRALYVVFKTTGGKAWNPPGGLRPLSETQKANRKKNIEQTLKNASVLKMAAAQQPDVPTRLYKPLPNYQLNWMKKKLAQAQEAVSLQAGALRTMPQAGPGRVPQTMKPFTHVSSSSQLPYAMRVKALANQIVASSSR